MHEIIRNKKVIFFDVGFTLNYPASGDWMFTNCFYANAGEKLSQRSEEEILRARSEGLDFLAANHLVRGEQEEAARFETYYSIISDALRLGLTKAQIAEIADDRTHNMANYILYPDTIKVLSELCKTHRLGIISDTWPSIEHQLDTLGIREYFSFTTFSCDLGVFKPDPKMFLDALEKSGCAPEDTVFVDDGPGIVAGAAKLGITPVLIAANPVSDVDTPFTKIHSLSELLV